MKECCLKTTNHEGKIVVFLEEQRVLHESKHPELRDKGFIDGRVKRAIESPDMIYQDFEHPDQRQAIYKEEFKINSRTRYTKVVIVYNKRRDMFFVVTAFRPDFIKEQNKTKMLYEKNKQ